MKDDAIREILDAIKSDSDSPRIKNLDENDIAELATGLNDELTALKLNRIDEEK